MKTEKLFLYYWKSIPINAYGWAALAVVAKDELEAFDIAEKTITEYTNRDQYFPPKGYTSADVLKASDRPGAYYIYDGYEVKHKFRKPGVMFLGFE